jgi:hypothetical protein
MHRSNFVRAALPALAAVVLSAAAAAQSCDGLGVVKLPGIDTAPTLSGGEQEFAAIAAGAGSYLAAWPDNRTHFGSNNVGEGSRDVFARRIAADGTPLDDVAFRVAGGLGRKQSVRIAWNGSAWLVTWSQVVPTTGFKAQHLFGARVSAAGEVLDPEPILIHDFDWYHGSDVDYALASDGSGWATAAYTAALVEGRVVHADGSVTAASAPLYVDTGLVHPTSMAFANGKYLLAVTDGNTKGVYLSPSLATLGAPFTLATKGNAQVATNGSSYLITYTDALVSYFVYARTLSATGAFGTPKLVTPSAGVEYAYDPAAAWNGTEWVVAFTHDLASPTEVFAARVAVDGTPIDFGGVPVATGTDARNAQIASLGDGNAEIVWVRSAGLAPYVSDVLCSSFGARGAAGAAQMLANGQPRQGDPDLAPGGEGYLAVFTSERDGLVHVVAQRLDRFGNPLDADVIELAAGTFLGFPRVAWNGQHFLVVWEDLGDYAFPKFETDDTTYGRRVAADGTVLDAAPFEVLLGGMGDVDAVGSTFLVAASRAVTTEIRNIYVTRVDAAGTVLDPGGEQISGNFSRWPTVASFDDRWLVTWQRNPTHDNPSSSVQYTVVLPDASTTGIKVADAGSKPRCAASDDVGLVLVNPEVRVLRVGKDGAALGPFVSVVSQPNLQLAASADWTGEEFVLAWEDERSFETFFDDRRDIYAASMLADGTVLGFNGCAVSVRPEHDQMPVVAGRDGDHLIAFAKYLPEAPIANVRVAYARGSEWTGIEGGIAGVAGLPVLDGDGALVPSGALQFALFGAAPYAPTLHVVGLARVDLPFFGGLLIPAPDVFLPTATGPGGSVTTSAPLPATLPAGLQLWVQSWVLDGAAVQAVSASNAIAQ